MIAFRLEHAIAHEPAGIRQRIYQPVVILFQAIFIELISILLYRIQIDFRGDRTLRIRDPAVDHVKNSRVNLERRRFRCSRITRGGQGEHGSLVAADGMK
jgi:hypothetical protein